MEEQVVARFGMFIGLSALVMAVLFILYDLIRRQRTHSAKSPPRMKDRFAILMFSVTLGFGLLVFIIKGILVFFLRD